MKQKFLLGDGCRDRITVPEGWSLVCSLVLGPDAHPRVSLHSYSRKEQEAGKRKSERGRGGSQRWLSEQGLHAGPSSRLSCLVELVSLELSSPSS